MTHSVRLRGVIDSDLPIFYEQQADPIANDVAAFPARGRDAFMAHWAKARGTETVTLQTILFDEQVAGNIVSYESSGEPEIGYWLGRTYWGKGIATLALSEFLKIIKVRPLYAHVAKHNLASQRVLQKCGFEICGEDKWRPSADAEEVEEFILKLNAIDHA